MQVFGNIGSGNELLNRDFERQGYISSTYP